MDRKQNDKLIGIIGGIDRLTPSYAMLNMLLSEAAKERRKKESKLTLEQRQERKRQQELSEIKRHLKARIMSGKCPECEGKLRRGKKSKKHDYQRLWTCSKCSHQFTWEGDNVQSSLIVFDEFLEH